MSERLYIQNRKKKRRRRDRLRLIGKGLLILFGCALFLFLIGRTVVKLVLPEDGDEYISLQDAGNLAWLLADTSDSIQTDPSGLLEALKKMDATEGEGYLTYAQAEELIRFLPESDAALLGNGKGKEKVSAAMWYTWFDAARTIYDPEGRIQDVSVTILASGEAAKKNDGTALSAQQLVTTEGEWTYFNPYFADGGLTGRTLTAVSRADELYAVRHMEAPGAFVLSNVWTIQASSEALTCFWNDYEIAFLGDQIAQSAVKGMKAGVIKQDAVADITFENGQVTAVAFKEDKISGRLLKIADGGAEIEGHGFFPFSEKLKTYQLYGRMKKLYTSDLRIGYAFTDFVVEDGQIEAALVPKEEKMEYIRVLVKTSDYGGAYHDSIELQADCDCTIVTGEYGSTEEQKLSAGEKLMIDKNSSLFDVGERIWVKPDILTGHISLLNVARAQGVPSYRGSFELVKSQDGIIAVNEVLLEEYLYAVVPSEMPASYPLEALKSQAICARTYAYAKMCHAGLASYGAHVDDSAGFQVYQNIGENSETTRAVKETKGQTLFYEDELAEVFYYSTSCGFGADASVWLNADAQDYPYLVSQKIGEGDHFYEEEEPWYRWQYEVMALDLDVLNLAILKRYEANADGVLTMQADGSFSSQKPPNTGKIKDISVALYGAGGVAQQLLIEGENATLLIKTEHNIRYVLCDGTTQVLRQDGSSVNAASMVPSAFFTFKTLKEDGFVVGYSLSGGGFGHGVGLSQNGARSMAAAGYASDDILAFFYKGCVLQEI